MRSFAVRCAVSGLVLFALAGSARGQELTPDKHYEIAGYLWGLMLASKIDNSRADVSTRVPFHDLYDHLSGGLMLHGRGEWDKTSVDLDGLWAKLRGENQSREIRLGPEGGIRIGATLKTGLSMWLVQGTGGYQLFKLGSMFSRSPSDERHVTAEIFAGGRYWSFNPNVNVAVNNRSRRVGDHTQWVDPVVGLRFGIDLSPTVVMGIGGDVGGFNIGNYCSEFTWSQNTMISWRFADSWRFHAGYRFVDFHRDTGDTSMRIQLRGPYLAVGYIF